jgi:hypothetical protein
MALTTVAGCLGGIDRPISRIRGFLATIAGLPDTAPQREVQDDDGVCCAQAQFETGVVGVTVDDPAVERDNLALNFRPLRFGCGQ